MARHELTFRVFVSSTFTDMRAERRILQQEVFPRLKAFCESKGASFQAMDLVICPASEEPKTQWIGGKGTSKDNELSH